MNEYISGLVSVIIPTYKRSDLLENAINTVLNQTYKNIELIIVNDNIPKDEYSHKLYELLSKYNDNRLVLIEQKKHINGAAARNEGIRIAKGEFISFQDDDDYWELNKIEKQVQLLKSLDSSYGAVSCLMRIYLNGKLQLATLPYRSGNILLDILERRTSLGTGAVLMRRTALDDAGYFDENLSRHQDLQLFSHFASKYKIKLDKVYLHNRESKDHQNRPDSSKLQEIKENYFNSISDIIENLSLAEKKRILALHNFECAYSFIKEKNIIIGVKKIKLIFNSPTTFYLALERVIRRIIEKKFRNYLDKKYSI